MTVPYNMVSNDAQRALEEFSDEFRGALALSDVTPWSTDLGLAKTSTAILTTYPIPIDAAGYKEFRGDMKYRDLYHRSLQMKTKAWQDGVSALAEKVEAPDFAGWADAPRAIALESQRQPNEWVAALLKANPNLDFYRDTDTNTASAVPLFSNSHPVNVVDSSVGTFDNDHTASSINDTFMSAAKLSFRSRKGPNGKPMKLQMTHLLVPAALEEAARDYLERDNLIQAVTNVQGTENVAAAVQRNRHYGTVTLVVGDELEDDDVVYALALGKPGLVPWIVQTQGAPEEIVQDKSSYLYQSQLKVGVSYILRGAAGLALPHCIDRYTIG